jgi:hypothetical protein
MSMGLELSQLKFKNRLSSVLNYREFTNSRHGEPNSKISSKLTDHPHCALSIEEELQYSAYVDCQNPANQATKEDE